MRVTPSIVLILLMSCAGREIVPDSEGAWEKPVQPEASATVSPPSSMKDSQTPPERASAEYHFPMAQPDSASGQSDRSIVEYKLALIYDPDSPILYTRLSAEYIRKGTLSLAMEAVKKAL